MYNCTLYSYTVHKSIQFSHLSVYRYNIPCVVYNLNPLKTTITKWPTTYISITFSNNWFESEQTNENVL